MVSRRSGAAFLVLKREFHTNFTVGAKWPTARNRLYILGILIGSLVRLLDCGWRQRSVIETLSRALATGGRAWVSLRDKQCGIAPVSFRSPRSIFEEKFRFYA